MSPTTKCTLCDWAFYTDGSDLCATLLLNAFLVDYKQCFLYYLNNGGSGHWRQPSTSSHSCVPFLW